MVATFILPRRLLGLNFTFICIFLNYILNKKIVIKYFNIEAKYMNANYNLTLFLFIGPLKKKLATSGTSSVCRRSQQKKRARAMIKFLT